MVSRSCCTAFTANYDAPGFTTSMPVEKLHDSRKSTCSAGCYGENYKTAEVVFPKTTRNAEGELRDPQIMYLTTESSVRIDVNPSSTAATATMFAAKLSARKAV